MILDIVAFGISTAFGQGQNAIQIALNNDREAMSLRPDIIGNDYRPQLCIFAPDAPLDTVTGRVSSLIAEALQDLTQSLARHQIGWPDDATLVLLTPGADVGFSASDATSLAHLMASRLQDAGWLGASGVPALIQGGAGSTVQALVAAAGLVASGRPVLLVTADSHCGRARMTALIESGALFSKENPWGFVPGEAACAALILPPSTDVPPAVRITGCAEATEPVPERLNKDSTHIGMTDAALRALEAHAQKGLSPPAHMFTDWNNSRYRAAEFSYTFIRLNGLIQPDIQDLNHPAQRFGQCGAGWLGAILGAVPVDPDTSSLVVCANDADGIRGAFVLCHSHFIGG